MVAHRINIEANKDRFNSNYLMQSFVSKLVVLSTDDWEIFLILLYSVISTYPPFFTWRQTRV